MATVLLSSPRRFIDTIDAPASVTSSPSLPDPEIFDEWYNTVNNNRFVCVDATVGALRWRRVLVPIFRALATLSSGSVIVSLPALTANMAIGIVELSANNAGAKYISSKTPGTGFTISSTNILDASIVMYEISIL
jgi:hypothetical protein